jgi:serine/threonine protein kinase
MLLRLEAPAAIGYACQIEEALEAAHSRAIVQPDLKPANVLMTPGRLIKSWTSASRQQSGPRRVQHGDSD